MTSRFTFQIISPILRALADENEYVRDTAYMAGKRLVTTYAETSVSLLLPELEKGLFDENWRIRHQSIQLLGDLLYKISGVTGKMTTETAGEDENFGTEQSQRVIIRLLGMERRDRVLAGLYMGRSDVALMVRQAALHGKSKLKGCTYVVSCEMCTDFYAHGIQCDCWLTFQSGRSL